MTSSSMVESVPLIPAALICSLAVLPFSGDRLARMTWYFAEAEVMTLAVA